MRYKLYCIYFHISTLKILHMKTAMKCGVWYDIRRQDGFRIWPTTCLEFSIPHLE